MVRVFLLEVRERLGQRSLMFQAIFANLAGNSLPPRFQPLCTARSHPHIVNRMAELWPLPEQLPAYFDELLLSPREGRRGFAFEVLTELFDLQAASYRYEQALHLLERGQDVLVLTVFEVGMPQYT